MRFEPDGCDCDQYERAHIGALKSLRFSVRISSTNLTPRAYLYSAHISRIIHGMPGDHLESLNLGKA
jgi:hypothetical protein